MGLVKTWWRAFSIVTLTALNVTQVSQFNIVPAFFTGGMLSWVWWANTRAANRDDSREAQFAYALGAACGTVTGMFLGGLWNR